MKTRILVCGNPGVGKSTILNSIVGSIKFPSGLSIGSGLTSQAKVVPTDDFEYADTPGLEDVTLGPTAAAEITKAMNVPNRNIKILFVITLEGGSLKASDIRTIRAVVGALEQTGVDMKGKYAVIVNKCETRVMELVNDRGFYEQMKAEVGMEWGVADIQFFPVVQNAAGVSDMLVWPRGTFTNLLNRLPEVKIPRGQHAVVVYENQMQQVLQLREQINVGRARLEQRERSNPTMWPFLCGIVAIIIVIAIFLF